MKTNKNLHEQHTSNASWFNIIIHNPQDVGEQSKPKAEFVWVFFCISGLIQNYMKALV